MQWVALFVFGSIQNSGKRSFVTADDPKGRSICFGSMEQRAVPRSPPPDIRMIRSPINSGSLRRVGMLAHRLLSTTREGLRA
jgi:hypothetical protein